MLEINKNRTETYSEVKNSLFQKIYKKLIIRSRNKFFAYFLDNTGYTDEKSVIDVGTTPSLDDEENIFLINTKNNQNITCLSNQDCKILFQKFNNIKDFLIEDGKNTNLKDNSFDIVHTNATIEHIGSYDNQISFVKEMIRISRKYIFIQTPNRFYPIDFHTILPIIHWFPKNIHRKLLKFFNLNFYSYEENLNLLSKKDLKNICKLLKLKNFKIIEHKLFFLTSNLILIIEK